MQAVRTTYPHINFIILTGDLVHDGSKPSYTEVRNIIENNSHVPCFFCLGNHDNRKNFYEVFTGEKNRISPYFYEHILENFNMRIIALDTSMGEYGMGTIGKAQLSLLKATLSANSHLDTIIIMHHTPFLGDDIDSLSYQVKESKEMLDIIRPYNISGIFAGHLHKCLSYVFGNTPCFVAESLSFGLDFTKTHAIANNLHGYNFVKMNGSNICVYPQTLAFAKPVEVAKSYEELYNTK